MLEAIPAKRLDFRLPMSALLNLPSGKRLVEEADELTVSICREGDSLHLQAETFPVHALTYTSDEIIDHIRDSSAQQQEEKEPATMGFQSLSNHISTLLLFLILLFIMGVSGGRK